jgi:1,4-alpha-glucan branching enzyme
MADDTDMGAMPLPSGGTLFRVWAPFARSVSAVGSFNGWNPAAHPLQRNGGLWSATVPEAKVGHQYKFHLVGINGEDIWRIDPYAREVTNSVGNGVIAALDPGSTAPDYRTPPWHELVIYELHIGTFLFDPASPTRRGTFDSVISRLGYLRDLGVNTIHVMAAQEFATDISWGYNPSHLFAIESAYGGPNGFRRFVDAAHSFGLAVILDVVYNHFGPSDLDLWRFDGWGLDGYGGIYLYNDGRSWTPWGDKNRPDYGRPEVRRMIRDNALRWLETRHCDGLRWDATNFIRNIGGNNNDPGGDIPDGWSLLQEINSEIDRRQPWKITIAEDMQENPAVTLNPSNGGAGFDAQWGADFVHTMRTALTARDDAQRDMGAVARVIGQRYNGSALQRVVFTESHDEVANGKARVPEEIWPANADSWPSKKRATLGAGIVFTSPGIPMIFMGQEFLQYGWFDDRFQLDWSLLNRHGGIHDLFRDLIRLRRNWFDTTRGLGGNNVNVHHVNHSDKLIAWHRWTQGGPRDDVIMLANLADRAWPAYRIGLPRGGSWRVRFNSDWSGYSPAFGDYPANDRSADAQPRDGMGFSADLSIGPYTLIVLSQDD